MTAPTDLVTQCSFLGHSVGGGVVPKMLAALHAVEAALKAQYTAANPGVPFAEWCGITGVGGFREHGGPHTRGIAVDLDYTLNPYIATRTGQHFGGEFAGAGLVGVREAAVEACDRIVGGTADLSCRKPGESTESVWDRLHLVSEGWKAYFSPWFNTDHAKVTRKPVPNWQSCPAGDFAPMVASGELKVTDLTQVPVQVLRDYEAVRIPTVIGSPSKSPEVTRNPARGFLTHPKHLAVAMCKVGKMRWGACDFGHSESGDIMHYDLA